MLIIGVTVAGSAQQPGVVSNSTISGVVWQDLNADGIRDGDEPFLSGRSVRLDLDNNGSIDLTTTTNGNGQYSFTPLDTGTHRVETEIPDAHFQTAPVVSEFNIEIVFRDNNLSASQKQIFFQAARRWSELITGDLPPAMLGPDDIVDDLRIDVEAPEIDGPGGILGQAGPRQVRNTPPVLPAYGIMAFDIADVDSLEAEGQFDEVILHEMGHVLGIGTLWELNNYLSGKGTSDPRYTGALAVEEYNTIFLNTEPDLPVENTGAQGTRDAHWRESVFSNELMTGYLNPGPENPLSVITVDSLADLGYVVNPDKADAYSGPGRGIGGHVHAGFCRIMDLKVEYVDLAPPQMRKLLPQVDTAGNIASEQVIIVAANQTVALDFGFSPLPATPTPSPSPTPSPTPVVECLENTVGDPSFESGGGSSSPWNDGSAVFGTVFCDSGCGADGARTGNYFLWFGGATGPELGFAEQRVTLGAELGELRFHLRIPQADGPESDYLRVLIDETELARFTVGDPNIGQFASSYGEVIIDISDFADGGTHTIRFESEVAGPGISNFFIDDVITCGSVGTPSPSPTVTSTATPSPTNTPAVPTPTASPTPTLPPTETPTPVEADPSNWVIY